MKNRLRKRYKEIIKKNQKSFVIDTLKDYLNKNKVGVYLDINNEISMNNIISDLTCEVYVPFMKDDGSKKIENAYMEFRKYDVNNLCYDDFKIKSSNGKRIDINELDCIVMPAICFNELGYRMGYGKACYDKALKDYNKMLIGVCYDNCVINEDFQEEHDLKVDYIFTEKRIIKIRG